MNDPYAHLQTVEQVERVERQLRAAHPLLWRVAELVAFVRNPIQYLSVRVYLYRRGYLRER